MPQTVHCQRDAYARRLSTRLTRCTPTGAGQYTVTLEDTILYPEGGGQPSDRGAISGFQVLDVQWGDDGLAEHLVETPVEVGPVEVEVDWARRFDHMQQHSAQHLITALAHDRLNMPTVAFHLGQRTCTIDLDTPDIAPADLEALEDAANAAIVAASPVRTREVTLARYDALGEAVRSRGLPASHSGDVRLVEIEGLDLNTCGGTHVRHLGELQMIKLVRTERTRGKVRLSYLAGGRVLAHLRASQARDVAATDLLRCAPEEHVEAIARLLAERKAAAQATRRRLSLLADYIGAELAANATGQPLLEMALEGFDLGQLQAIARRALEGHTDRFLLLTSDLGAGSGVFLVAGPKDAVAVLGPEIATLLGGRGGGRAGRFQGKASRLSNRAEAIARLTRGV